MASKIKVEGPIKNSKLDQAAKAGDVKMSCMKDGSASDATSCVSSGDATSSIKENEVERESVRAKQGMYYPVNGNSSYYYQEYDAQSYYLGTGGLGIQPSASQVDNGPLMYYFPNFQPHYTPYNSFLPGATPNVDGQYLGQQLYYPSSLFSPPFVSPGLFPQPVAYAPELIPAYSWNSSQLYTDGIYGNIYGDSTYSAPKPNFSSQRHTHIPSKNLPTSKFGTTEAKGSSRTANLSPNLATSNQPHKPLNKVSILSNGFLPVKKLPSYPNQGRSGLSWVGTEKLKARNKVSGSGDLDLMNEQNRGPRIMGVKSNLVAIPVGSLETEENASDVVVRKDEYNLLDFATRYDHALFFVIKSYSEDDIHKSIKYNVWASTPNGNKRLDNAFQVAQEKMAEKGSKCPVFLFFSVNASGQFCGVAEMTGRVDFNMSMDFWQQDKWTGYFPVKWHIIKDIPNPQFRNIILENNENKPVTNSRDTQEVKLIQGTEMLNIFKNYNSKTSILDDFGFYEERQKAMRDKRRSKDPTPCLENLQPKIEVMDQDAIVSDLLSLKLAVDDAKKQLPTGDKVKE